MTLTFVARTENIAYGIPGPLAVQPNNTQGNHLICMVAWNVQAPSSQIGGPGPLVPCSAVADDQGNRWRHVADSGNDVSGARCAIWMCTNALPVTKWLSACVQGNCVSMAMVVYEFSGAVTSYWPVIDFTVNTNSPSSTSLSLSPVTTQADYCFSVGCTGDTSVTITGPTGTGWGVLDSISVGASSPDGLQMNTGWLTAAAATTVATSYTLNAARSFAMCVIGISQANALPLQQKDDFPLVVTEAAFGATIGDPTAAILDNQWTDISSYAAGPGDSPVITATRGRQYELSTPEAGELSIRMNNQTGAFNPSNVGSPFYSSALNQNMSFQSGIAPWVGHSSAGSGTVLAQSSAAAFSSATNGVSKFSLAIITPASSVTNPGASSEPIPISVNYQYTATAYFNLAVGASANVQVIINWYTSGLGLISSSAGTTVTGVVGSWVQSIAASATPPATAAFARIIPQVNGTTVSAMTIYVAEASLALVTNSVSTTQTGLVRLGTPIRVTAFWNGRNYPVGWGLVERWPQAWPDFSQWSWSQLIASDLAGAAAVNLPSALQGELLADNPYACFPFNEQYSSSSNTLNGVVKTASETDGQVALNTALNNQRPAVYIDGNQAIATGQTMNFTGDTGTGAGTTGYGTFDLSGNRGPGAQYGPDLLLPSLNASNTGNISLEVWTTVPTFNAGPASQFTSQLYEVLVNPNLASNGSTNLAQGALITGGLLYVNGSLEAQQYWQPSWSAGVITVGAAQLQGTLLQCGFVLANGNIYFLQNGGLSGASGGAVSSGNLYALAWGLSTSVTGSRGAFDGNFNYAMSYGVLFPYQLSPSRTNAHYFAGAFGWTNDQFTQRAGRYVAWSRVNVGLAGPTAALNALSGETPLLGPAYGIAGQQMNAALTNDAISTGGRWGAVGTGNLVVIPRTRAYNITNSITYGDAPVGPLNANVSFTSGTSGWTALNSATIAQVAGQGFGTFNMRITPNSGVSGPGFASTGTGTSAIPVTASTQYVAGAWMMSAAGLAAGGSIFINWYTSAGASISTSTSNTLQLATAGAWTYGELLVTSPANAAFAQINIIASGVIPSTSLFYVDRFTFVLATDQVPYDPASMSIDYDNSYVNNSTQATLVSGANSLAAPVVSNQNSVVKYLQRGPLSQQVSGQTTEDAYDRAYWSLNLYSEPSMRISSISVAIATRPFSFYSVLQTDINDVIVVSRNPGGAQQYTLPVTIEQVNISIGPGIWDVHYQMSPYVLPAAVLTTGSGTTGLLGSNALPW